MNIRKLFDSELAARRYMSELERKGVKFSYYHESGCRYWVTLL